MVMICYTETRSMIFHTIHLGKIIERKPVPEEMGNKDGTTESLLQRYECLFAELALDLNLFRAERS